MNSRQLSTNLPIVEEDEAAAEVARLYEYFRSRFGRTHVPGILKCFATHPAMLRHMMELAETLLFTDGSLNRRTKEMIATLVSSQNSCVYCADSHGYQLRVNGGSAEVLGAIQQNDLRSPSLTPPEQELLRFAGKINWHSHQISPDDIEKLRSSGWSDLQIAETIHIAALFATYNRVVNAFGLPSQEMLALYTEEGNDHQ